jgi:hypothetical protein
MVVRSAVAVVEINLGVVNLGDEPAHDFVLSEGPWDLYGISMCLLRCPIGYRAWA